MTVNTLLGIPSLNFIEPDYASLPDTGYNGALASLPGDEGRLLIDEHDTPLALAIGCKGEWTAGCFHLREPDIAVLERFEATAGEIWQEERETWECAVREYYSARIQAQAAPSMDDCNPGRIGKIRDLLADATSSIEPGPCLDFCCGSGIGSLVLRDLGFQPLSLDNDPNLLSRGLAEGRLLPSSTICIDARRASLYTRPETLATGLMFGEITPFSEDLWKSVTMEMVSLSSTALITVGTETEAVFIEKVLAHSGREVTRFENMRDSLYDHFVCIAHK